MIALLIAVKPNSLYETFETAGVFSKFKCLRSQTSIVSTRHCYQDKSRPKTGGRSTRKKKTAMARQRPLSANSRNAWSEEGSGIDNPAHVDDDLGGGQRPGDRPTQEVATKSQNGCFQKFKRGVRCKYEDNSFIAFKWSIFKRLISCHILILYFYLFIKTPKRRISTHTLFILYKKKTGKGLMYKTK